MWDGTRLSVDGDAGGRSFQIDRRCVEGDPVRGAWAHVCALTDDAARMQFDQPEVQQVRRDALAWWIPLLGVEFVCLSTLALDEVYCGGAITVARSPGLFDQDPFGRLFAGTVVRCDVLCAVAPPVGPVVERYAGTPWPAERF